MLHLTSLTGLGPSGGLHCPGRQCQPKPWSSTDAGTQRARTHQQALTHFRLHWVLPAHVAPLRPDRRHMIAQSCLVLPGSSSRSALAERCAQEPCPSHRPWKCSPELPKVRQLKQETGAPRPCGAVLAKTSRPFRGTCWSRASPCKPSRSAAPVLYL